MYKCCRHCDPTDDWHEANLTDQHSEPCNLALWCEGKQQASA